MDNSFTKEIFLKGGNLYRIKMTGLKRLVLDVLKPLEKPGTVELSKILSKIDGVKGVNITVLEIDKQTESIKVTIEGDDLDYDTIQKQLEKYGAVIHSTDEVASGSKIVESVETAQDQ